MLTKMGALLDHIMPVKLRRIFQLSLIPATLLFSSPIVHAQRNAAQRSRTYANVRLPAELDEKQNGVASIIQHDPQIDIRSERGEALEGRLPADEKSNPGSLPAAEVYQNVMQSTEKFDDLVTPYTAALKESGLNYDEGTAAQLVSDISKRIDTCSGKPFFLGLDANQGIEVNGARAADIGYVLQSFMHDPNVPHPTEHQLFNTLQSCLGDTDITTKTNLKDCKLAGAQLSNFNDAHPPGK